MSTESHAEYPHKPGTLYNCPVCEAVCWCEDIPTGCVHCAHEGYGLEGEGDADDALDPDETL